MLSFDIRSLESKAEQVNGSLSPDDDVWQEGDARPAKPVEVSGRLSSANEGRFYFSGLYLNAAMFAPVAVIVNLPTLCAATLGTVA